jgi:hypothetical protein
VHSLPVVSMPRLPSLWTRETLQATMEERKHKRTQIQRTLPQLTACCNVPVKRRPTKRCPAEHRRSKPFNCAWQVSHGASSDGARCDYLQAQRRSSTLAGNKVAGVRLIGQVRPGKMPQIDWVLSLHHRGPLPPSSIIPQAAARKIFHGASTPPRVYAFPSRTCPLGTARARWARCTLIGHWLDRVVILATAFS